MKELKEKIKRLQKDYLINQDAYQKRNLMKNILLKLNIEIC
jgi:hypothetical protein